MISNHGYMQVSEGVDYILGAGCAQMLIQYISATEHIYSPICLLWIMMYMHMLCVDVHLYIHRDPQHITVKWLINYRCYQIPAYHVHTNNSNAQTARD